MLCWTKVKFSQFTAIEVSRSLMFFYFLDVRVWWGGGGGEGGN